MSIRPAPVKTTKVINRSADEVALNSHPKIENPKVGNYILGKTLGQGTFGKVKLAMHKLSVQKVAVKILEKKKITNLSDLQLVNREIQILKQLRHFNVIQLFEVRLEIHYVDNRIPETFVSFHGVLCEWGIVQLHSEE